MAQFPISHIVLQVYAMQKLESAGRDPLLDINIDLRRFRLNWIEEENISSGHGVLVLRQQAPAFQPMSINDLKS